MQRREFLQTTITAAALTPIALGKDSEKESWIDAHVHVWTPDTDKYPLSSKFKKSDMSPASFTPEQLFVHTKPEGVGRVVLIQMSYYQFDNQYMLDCIEKHPGVFAGVAIVDEEQPHLVKTMTSLATKGVRGFRLYANQANTSQWSRSTGLQMMWKNVADTGQSVCLLADPEVLPIIEKQCSLYPKSRVVIDHFARIGIDGKIREQDLDNLCRLAQFENVYVKVSAYYALGAKKAPYTDLSAMIGRLLKEYGASRLMWASDCPFQVGDGHTYRDSIGLIRDRLDIVSDEDKRWLLRDTAAKVFFG